MSRSSRRSGPTWPADEPARRTWRRATSWLGFTCVALVWLAVLAAAAAYSGAYGEAYSFLNHNISEVGEVGVSERALWA